ncbi:MAG: winged helix-turn-helix domain-containing protein [Thermoguttaceae bacterium]
MSRKKTKSTKNTKAANKGEAKAKKLSALDAAAKVLKESGKELTVKEILEAILAKGYWKSPAGKTPRATIYSSIIREITKQGKASRFRKADRGKFVVNK